MTDLPRFYQGSAGRLDFTALNEMMKRLDALLPLAESAALTESRGNETKSRIFLVKAKRKEPGSEQFEWRECLFDTSDRAVVEGEEGFEEIVDNYDVSFRFGGFGDNEDDYGVLLDTSNAGFEEGLAICFVNRNVEKRTRYVLQPLAFDAPWLIFVTTTTGTQEQIQLAADLTINVMKYQGRAFKPGPPPEPREEGLGPEDEGETGPVEWTEYDGESYLYDLSYHVLNTPIHNSGATIDTYHMLEVGTVITPHFESGGISYLGTLPRLDFECKR